MKTLIFASVLLIPIYLFTGCNGDDNHMDEDHMEGTQMDEQMDDHEMTSTERTDLDSSVIRDKNIDVASLDKNGDGKVFQCPMDYEVISDEFGNCPLCNMKLKEYSVEKAKENFKKVNHK